MTIPLAMFHTPVENILIHNSKEMSWSKKETNLPMAMVHASELCRLTALGSGVV